MEQEMEIKDENLAEVISMRRRSNSVSDDYSTQRTNDDATQCKYFAVKKGYWKDEFIERFVSPNGTDESTRRFPEISMGYWARMAVFETYIKKFIQQHKEVQIISLGAGFDTLFWRLRRDNLPFVKYVEVDFSTVTARKIRHILKPGSPAISEYFTEKPNVVQHCDLHAGNYHLLGADLRQIDELNHKLDSALLDPNLPTFCMAECVLVYLTVGHSANLIEALAKRFKTLSFLDYEQFRTSDAFTKVMEANLELRGIQLHGLSMSDNAERQKQRFQSGGFQSVSVFDMLQVYKGILDPTEVSRICKIEQLDEMELLHQLLTHYCVVHAEK